MRPRVYSNPRKWIKEERSIFLKARFNYGLTNILHCKSDYFPLMNSIDHREGEGNPPINTNCQLIDFKWIARVQLAGLNLILWMYIVPVLFHPRGQYCVQYDVRYSELIGLYRGRDVDVIVINSLLTKRSKSGAGNCRGRCLGLGLLNLVCRESDKLEPLNLPFLVTKKVIRFDHT